VLQARASRRDGSAALEELLFALGETFGFERFERLAFRFTVNDANNPC
jgi:hypothetical protein